MVARSSAPKLADEETMATTSKQARHESRNAPRRDRISLLANITVEPRKLFEDKGGKAIYPYLTHHADYGQGKPAGKGGRSREIMFVLLLRSIGHVGIAQRRSGKRRFC